MWRGTLTCQPPPNKIEWEQAGREGKPRRGRPKKAPQRKGGRPTKIQGETGEGARKGLGVPFFLRAARSHLLSNQLLGPIRRD